MKILILIIILLLSACFMGFPVDYFDKIAKCETNHSDHKEICEEVARRTKGYPRNIDFEAEYQKLLKEQQT